MAIEPDPIETAAMQKEAERLMYVATQRYNAALMDYHADIVDGNNVGVAAALRRAHDALDLQLAAIRMGLELRWMKESRGIEATGSVQ